MAEIKTHPANGAYRDGFERVFGKRGTMGQSPTPSNLEILHQAVHGTQASQKTLSLGVAAPVLARAAFIVEMAIEIVTDLGECEYAPHAEDFFCPHCALREEFDLND